MITAPAAVGTTAWVKENIAGALAYLTFVPAIILLRTMPFKRNHFVRFHSLQCIFLTVAGLVVALATRLVYDALCFIPRLGYLMAWLAVLLVVLGWIILWLVVMVKALQGELFKLPVIGDLAEKY